MTTLPQTLIAALLLPMEDAQSGAGDDAVGNALDIASLLGGGVVGALIAFIGAALVSAALRRMLRRWAPGAALVKRVRTPLYVTFMTWGAWLGLGWMLQGDRKSVV